MLVRALIALMVISLWSFVGGPLLEIGPVLGFLSGYVIGTAGMLFVLYGPPIKGARDVER